MAGPIIWTDPQAWAIPNTDEQNRQLRKYGGSSNMPGAAYGAKGPAVITRQYAEQMRAKTGSYPKESRIIEIDGTETNRPGVSPPTPSKSWGEFLTGSPSSAAAKEQQIWARATGQNPPPTIQTLPQQLSERRAYTESVTQDPRGAMAQPRFQSGQAYAPPAVSRSPVATSGAYRPLTGITYKHEAGPNTSSSYEAMGLTRTADAERYGSMTLPQNIEDINRGGRYSPMAYGERPRAVDELRRELRDPMYQSRYDFKGIMAEQDAQQQMVQEADKAAQEARQNSATTSQSGVTPAQGSMHGQQSVWIGSRPIGGGNIAAQHVSGRWFLNYDLNNPWD
jgi:hypothetical protein